MMRYHVTNGNVSRGTFDTLDEAERALLDASDSYYIEQCDGELSADEASGIYWPDPS